MQNTVFLDPEQVFRNPSDSYRWVMLRASEYISRKVFKILAIYVEHSSTIIAKIQKFEGRAAAKRRARNKRNAAMSLDLSRNTESIGLRATSALALAMFEQTGLRRLIDSEFDIDVRQKLSPGNAVKAFIGDLAALEGKGALNNVSNIYATAPTEKLFGSHVKAESLNPTALSRNLDMLFDKDLSELTYRCYRTLAERYHLDSNVFNIDSTNFGITALDKGADMPLAAVPERCGHAKDGHHERLVYSLLSITDENSVVCYEKPYNGSTADQVMDRDAVEFLSGKVEPRQSVVVADCKIATIPLVDLMCSKGFGFVAKCPDNFGKKIRRDIVYSVSKGTMDPSSVRDGWEIYDTDAEVDGRRLRFVAYRTAEDIEVGIRYHATQGRKEAEALINRFASRLYNCDEDARRDVLEVLPKLDAYAFDVMWEIVPVEIPMGYGHRGRPRKDEKPLTKTEYRVDIELVFNVEKAKRLSQDRGVSVLVTNLPRANADAKNIRFGATADTVLLTYLGQYQVEHAFRLMKDGMGLSRVYIQKPSRENAMMFVISLMTMMTDVIDHMFKKAGMGTTFASMVERMKTLILRYTPDLRDSYLMGNERHISEYVDALNVLGIDTDKM